MAVYKLFDGIIISTVGWWPSTGHTACVVLFIGVIFLSTVPAGASDEYIAGYAAAILEHEFRMTGALVEIRQGAVIVTTRALGNVDRGKVESALRQIPGVTQVEIRETDHRAISSVPSTVQTSIPESASKWLPHSLLFSPLHADPRWPRFGTSYRVFTQGLNLSGTFAGNFGETFSIYRNKAPFGGEWDVGIQAGVFSLFDVSTASIDLINADYRVGFLSGYRNDRFSAIVRVQHQSSHLGDEFLLGNPNINRVNVSYEEFDTKVSYELFDWLRVYGGGGLIVRRYPDNLGRATTQWGAEFTSTRTYLDGGLRPVAYADFQCNERTNWEINRSILAGVQFENARIGDRRIQLLAEYYAGPSPDGQFYIQRVGWYGIGVHLYF
jgi:Protein of unknown function (DUF1207)